MPLPDVTGAFSVTEVLLCAKNANAVMNIENTYCNFCNDSVYCNKCGIY